MYVYIVSVQEYQSSDWKIDSVWGDDMKANLVHESLIHYNYGVKIDQQEVQS